MVVAVTDTFCPSLQTPNVLSKHPYLAQSTPLRHMAKCLRQASQSDMPKKLSPVRVSPSYEFPPPPASWTKLSREESNEANNHTAGELKTRCRLMKILFHILLRV